MSKIPELSVAVITLNEEQNIERCLMSVRDISSDIIILDSGSQDKTIEIARKYTDQVHFRKWSGFRDQKQAASDLCKNDWVLSIDADEVLTEELKNELRSFFSSPLKDKIEAVNVPRLSYHLKKWIHYGGWYPDFQTKLFNKQKCKWGGGAVHEKIEATLTHKFSSHLQHYVFKNMSHQVATNNKYSSFGALDLKNNNKKFSYLKLIFKPIGKFIECYFIKRGFLDGLPGFIIAVGAAYSMFLKYAKLKYIDLE